MPKLNKTQLKTRYAETVACQVQLEVIKDIYELNDPVKMQEYFDFWTTRYEKLLKTIQTQQAELEAK